MIAVEKDPRLLIEVDNLPLEGWSFDDVLVTERVTALLNEHGSTDLTAVTPLRAQLSAHKVSHDSVRLTGHASVHLTTPCGRCLNPAPVEVGVDLDMTLFPAPVRRAPQADEAAAPAAAGSSHRRGGKRPPEVVEEEEGAGPMDGDLDTGTYENGEVDVAELLREQVLLEIPITPLCKADCKGLCQSCGKDLNEGACDCRPQQGDPRLAALARFKLD